MMFALIWTLLAVTGASEASSDSCKTNSSTNITAQAGSCVVLPCLTKFTKNDKSVEWYRCGVPYNCSKLIFSSTDTNSPQPEFKGQVSLLESESKENCSIIITDLTTSDSGLYQVRVKDGENSCNTYGNVYLTVQNQKPKVVIPPLAAGQQTTLTCTAPGFCSGSKPNITWMWRGAEEKDTQIKGNSTHFISDTKAYSSNLTFNVSAVHHNTNITCKISFSGNISTEETKTLEVPSLKISGNQTVTEGDALNLTCTVAGFTANSIKWTKSDSDKILDEKIINDTQESIEPVSLTILNVTADDSGQYTCTAANRNTTLTAQTDITVKFTPKILNVSSCHNESEVLTCVCVSEGFPSPTIKWPVLEGRTSYSVMTNVSQTRITSTLTVSLESQSTTTVECVSRNEVGEAIHNLPVKSHNHIQQEGNHSNILEKLLETLKNLDFYYLLLIGFLIGILLSAAVACLAKKCQRGRQKRLQYHFEDLEMVTTETAPKVEVERNGIQDHETAEDWTASAGQSAPGEDVEPKETEYSDIDFSVMKNRNPTGAQETQETTETEYAEIKKERLEEGEENEEGEIVEINDEEWIMIKENKNPENNIVAEEAVGEDVPLYSDVKDEINEIHEINQT